MLAATITSYPYDMSIQGVAANRTIRASGDVVESRSHGPRSSSLADDHGQNEYFHHNGTHLTGPRPPPSSSSASSTSTIAAPSNSQHPYYRSNTSGNASVSSFGSEPRISRASTDQTSVHSSDRNSNNRGSIFSHIEDLPKPGTFNLSAIMGPQTMAPPPPPSHSYSNHGHKHKSDKHEKQSIKEFHLEKPKDERVIEKMFIELMNLRDFRSLPEQAKRQMQAYPASKKWTLIYQDRLSEWQNEQRKIDARNKANSMALGAAGVASIAAGVSGVRWDDAVDEGSPQWYVRKLYSDGHGGQRISVQQLGSLAVSLRTQSLL